jgi:hypothetical protein
LHRPDHRVGNAASIDVLDVASVVVERDVVAGADTEVDGFIGS